METVAGSEVECKMLQLWEQLDGVSIPTLESVSGVASGKSLNTSEPRFLLVK